jgi:mRNA interferase HicA
MSGAEIVRALERGGFVVDRQRGSHVTLRHPLTRRSTTVPVHSGRTIPVGTLTGILEDAGLTRSEFRRLLK